MLPDDSQTSGKKLLPIPLWHDILTLYSFSGAIVGAVGGAGSVCASFAYLHYWHQQQGIRRGFAAVGPPGLGELLGFMIGSALSGAMLGFACGLVLFVLTLLWPAAKHPVRSASMCASLGGTLFLLIFALVFDFSHVNLENCLGFAALLAGGAFYGFMTAWIMQRLERRYRAVMEKRLAEQT